MSDDTGFLAAMGKIKDDYSELIESIVADEKYWKNLLGKSKKHATAMLELKKQLGKVPLKDTMMIHDNIMHWITLVNVGKLGGEISTVNKRLAKLEKTIKDLIKG